MLYSSKQLQEGPFEGIKTPLFRPMVDEARAIILINGMQKQQRVNVPVSSLNTG